MQDGDSRSEEALAALCEGYWLPIYAYARRRGHSSEQAEDLTQGFFTKLLEKRYLDQADRKRGKFRTFLLSSFKHYMANEWDRSQALKRGGGQRFVSLDVEQAEGRFSAEPADAVDPERLFARQWARTLLDRVLDRLALEMERSGNAERFERLKIFLTGWAPAIPYSEVAADLEMSEVAVKVAVNRMRGKFRDLLLDEVAQTVESEEAVAEEIRFLIDALWG